MLILGIGSKIEIGNKTYSMVGFSKSKKKWKAILKNGKELLYLTLREIEQALL